MTFSPDEIIFSLTTACNLRCPCCYVSRSAQKLDIAQAEEFLCNCAPHIQKVGFSGGEPFLYLDFLLALTKKAVQLDLMFDQIMTNGVWWNTKEELKNTLTALYEAGYDGKICLSWDSFHAQETSKAIDFIKTVQELFGEDSITIQSIKPYKKGTYRPAVQFAKKNNMPCYILPQTFQSEDSRAWKNLHWFKEDFCSGPGHVLYVHADGNIAPCCGFANENPALFIGNITDSFEKIMQNAAQNRMVRLCYEEGLSAYRAQLKKAGSLPKGKCADNCSFCDYVCKAL